MQLIKFLLREFHLFIIFFKCYNEFGRCWELILFFFHVRFCVLVYLDIYSLLCYLFLSLFFLHLVLIIITGICYTILSLSNILGKILPVC